MQIPRLHRNEVISVFILAVVLLTAGTLAAWYWFLPLPKLPTIRRLADLGRWEEAEAGVHKYLSRKPADADALMLAARVAAGRGDLGRCAELLERIPATSQLKLEALLRQGQTLREMHYARRAEQAFREAIRLADERGLATSPNLFSARIELVVLMSLERRVSETKELLWQLYPAHREKWRILISLARLEGRSAHPHTVMPLLQKCIEQDPTDFDARRGLARYYLESSLWSEAAEQANYCLEHDPGDASSLEIMLECHFRLQQWEEMDEILARPQFDIGSARVWRLRAQRLEALGKGDEAEKCFHEALRLDPNDPTIHFQLSQLLRRQGHGEAADEHHVEFRRLQEHEEAIARVISSFTAQDDRDWSAPDPETCTELGAHCMGLGRNEEARAWSEEALLQQPKFQPAIDQLRRLAEIGG
jgi:tetratricopeptide (TPR) repeat protein